MNIFHLISRNKFSLISRIDDFFRISEQVISRDLNFANDDILANFAGTLISRISRFFSHSRISRFFSHSQI